MSFGRRLPMFVAAFVMCFMAGDQLSSLFYTAREAVFFARCRGTQLFADWSVMTFLYFSVLCGAVGVTFTWLALNAIERIERSELLTFIRRTATRVKHTEPMPSAQPGFPF